MGDSPQQSLRLEAEARDRKETIMAKKRQTRSDCRIGTLERMLGLGAGAFRHPNGRDIRSDMKLGTLRKKTNRK